MAKAQTAKKKYTPEILNSYKYRGFKIQEVLNKKTRRREFKTRFQINNKEFYLTDERRKHLEEIIDETLVQERRAKYELPTLKSYPSVGELFAEHANRLKKEGSRKKISIFERVSEKLLAIFPPGIKVNELKKNHFQRYIDARLDEINSQSEKRIQPETVNKELSAVSVAFKNAALHFPELDALPQIVVPKISVSKDRRRTRLVDKEKEFAVLLEYLRRDHRNSKTAAARQLLADDLEMRYETGLRRSESAFLKKPQYRAAESALRDVFRIKTGTTTKFFPLSRRAVEIIEARLTITPGDFIFSKNGKPNEGAYRTLKTICAELGINYGTHADGGFVPHDLRHNFATDIIRVTDIETAKNLTGHTGEHILTYLHTDEGRMRDAVRRREGFDLTEELTTLYNEIKNGKLNLSAFLEKARFLTKNG